MAWAMFWTQVMTVVGRHVSLVEDCSSFTSNLAAVESIY
jgi:hypothetical protein